MERFLNSIKNSLENKNWYSALALALSVPDICAKISYPAEKSSKKRYIAWYNSYMIDKYTSYIGANKEKHVFLCGEDCYALRCSFLHEGRDNIEKQKAQEALDKFHFTIPKHGFTIHNNQINKVLQLQIDVFCNDICESVRLWNKEEGVNKEYQNTLIYLYDVYDNKII